MPQTASNASKRLKLPQNKEKPSSIGKVHMTHSKPVTFLWHASITHTYSTGMDILSYLIHASVTLL